jgi:hypothetical protein
VTVENGEKRKPTAGFLALFMERKIINTSSGFVAQPQKKIPNKDCYAQERRKGTGYSISRRDDPFRESKAAPAGALAQIHH